MSESTLSKMSALRALPSVDQLLRTETAEAFGRSLGLQCVAAFAREVTEQMRAEIQSSEGLGHFSREKLTKRALLTDAVQRLENSCKRQSVAGIRRVINATGVILHTNLGRAPLSEAARKAIAGEAAGYCTIEYDLTTGTRGPRGERVEQLLTYLTGAEDALVVNNCAAAALLILTVLASDGETIVSRGELVEIGGDFRIPDVMANSGTRMIEVGTTNRTRLDDYRRVINQHSRLIMRIHPSNYRIIGFTASPPLSDLVSLAHDAGLPLYQDAGSGVLTPLDQYGLDDEPLIRDCVSDGADVVSFSGDKLLGSTQAGLIVGRREIVTRLRKHSMYRALRVDKVCLAALEATLNAFRRGTAVSEIPALRMLSLTSQEIQQRAQHFIARLFENPGLQELFPELLAGESAVGGGSGPNTQLPTTLIALSHSSLSADEIERRLRLSNPPVITRIAEGKVLLDLRTVAAEDEPDLLRTLTALYS